MLYILLQLIVLTRIKNIVFGVKSSVPKPYFCFPMDYVLLFATVIKCIAPQTFNHRGKLGESTILAKPNFRLKSTPV